VGQTKKRDSRARPTANKEKVVKEMDVNGNCAEHLAKILLPNHQKRKQVKGKDEQRAKGIPKAEKERLANSTKESNKLNIDRGSGTRT